MNAWILSRNRAAKSNGETAEQFAIEEFELTPSDKKLFDAYMGDVPVEIKCCQKYQRNGKRNGKQTYIHGRFTLCEAQHEYLVENDGVYLFIVKHGFRYAFAAIPAKEIEFKRKLSWTKVFSPKHRLIFDFLQ